ncbi:MAG: SAM-dependent methyltransferase [Geobacteraceae bacterium]
MLHPVPIILLLLAVFTCPTSGWSSPQEFTITGLVKRPLALSLEDLAKFHTTTLRINDIKKNGAYHGVFTTQGVPLKNLLDVALVEKEASNYAKPIDLAIVVRDKSGNKVALSWGEVFYRNPADVVIAYSATPVMPHHDNCGSCHTNDFTKPYLDQLSRTISLPKLVIANDFDSDRSLEGIVSIEVVNLQPKGTVKKKGELFSPRLVFSGQMENPVTIFSLDNLPRATVAMNIVGDGRGFHGRGLYSGVPLAELVTAVGIEPDLRSVIIISSPDGYRALVSWGELTLSPQGQRIIVADEVNGKPIEKGGKFMLVLPDDLATDREVKAVAKIEVQTFKEPAKVYLISMGPGDTSLISQKAISSLGKTDAVVAPGELYKAFASYLAGKPLLFDATSLNSGKGFTQTQPEISSGEIDVKLNVERQKALQSIREQLAEGHSIAFLDQSEPLISSNNWIRKQFTDAQIEVVPGISSFNAASTVLGRDLACNGALIMTTPQNLAKNEALVKAAADNGATLVISDGRKEFRNLIQLLMKLYPVNTPIAIVYNAGVSSKERKVAGTVQDLLAKTGTDEEDLPWQVYVGPCLSE